MGGLRIGNGPRTARTQFGGEGGASLQIDYKRSVLCHSMYYVCEPCLIFEGPRSWTARERALPGPLQCKATLISLERFSPRCASSGSPRKRRLCTPLSAQTMASSERTPGCSGRPPRRRRATSWRWAPAPSPPPCCTT